MTLQRKVSIFGFVILSFITLYFLGNSEIFKLNPYRFSNLITADVLLTIPFIYFLLIRKTSISKLTVVPITIAGVILASFIIPEEHQTILNYFKTWVLPIIELLIVSFIIFKVVKTIKTYKVNREIDTDFYTVLKKTCQENFPDFAANALATEISVFYYGFINWKKQNLKSNEFTYHKNSGSISLFAALILIIVVESVGVHYLLRQSENQIGLWILTILSLYTGFQFFGYIKSIIKRPIAITKTKLLLRYGIMKEAEVRLENILAVEISSRDIDNSNRIKRLSLLSSLESHNFIIHFKDEIIMTGLYGIKRKAKSIAFSIDKPEDFKLALKDAKSKLQTKID